MMAVLNTRKPFLIVVAIVLGLGLLAVFLSQRLPSDPEVLAQETLPQPEASSETEAQDAGDPELPEPRRYRQSARSNVEAKASKPEIVSDAQEPFPHELSLAEYKAELWSDIQASPPGLELRGDPAIDAEKAYRLYMYHTNCSMMPRTDIQIDMRLKKIADRVETAESLYLEGLEQRADLVLDFYALCKAIPPEVNSRLEAVTWLAAAVRLGHEVAQIEYYEKAMGLLLRPDRDNNSPALVMEHSGLIDEFKATATFALGRAMKKGHPEAFLAMSQAILEGIIYPRDPAVAYAFARAAELSSMRSRRIWGNIGYWKEAAGIYLDRRQRMEADRMARELRSQYSG